MFSVLLKNERPFLLSNYKGGNKNGRKDGNVFISKKRAGCWYCTGEKAFAYKMRLEAMKHQGRIGSSTSDLMEPKSLNELVELSVLEAEVHRNGKITIKETGTTRETKGLRSNEELARMVGERFVILNVKPSGRLELQYERSGNIEQRRN